MMVALFEWFVMAILCLAGLFGVLLLVFALACLVVIGTKKIKEEVEKDDGTEQSRR